VAGLFSGAEISFHRVLRMSPTLEKCLPMYDANAADAALTLPISVPTLKSWSP
jgi:hypothetical protein